MKTHPKAKLRRWGVVGAPRKDGKAAHFVDLRAESSPSAPFRGLLTPPRRRIAIRLAKEKKVHPITQAKFDIT
ncbi:hypothetical protein CQW49_23855 (plasmid) [Methylosinus trichosporium OB3b]|uniref:Uncharacterized protein n=1 Tax=Methylosinus trichosporium (strain ATCC 35070 / NCIMB 11131 / UNIQEM 75 / OB3b) TaxID=595536 RepID=A0A2D2D7Q4_METT3|nr:hypothetical protein CQW49_23855 [Methylosinus trichosporium OB3b]OBS50540.1 hypothetical protein A8B73_21040 [Methylosinus sp. 3S-1]